MNIISVTDYISFPVESIHIDGPIEAYKPNTDLPTIEVVITYEDGSQVIYETNKLQIIDVPKTKFYCTVIHGNIYVYMPKYFLNKSSLWKKIKSWINVTFFQRSRCFIYTDVKLKEEK